MSGLYVQYGCGDSTAPGWLNFDSSPTLKMQRIPWVGGVVAHLTGVRFPHEARYGDIVAGLPVVPLSVRGLYASHILEHLSLADMRLALRNSFRILEPQGTFRLIVPDLLERARIYVRNAERGDPDAAHRFLASTYLGCEAKPQGAIGSLRSVIGNSGHLWMWDYASMCAELVKAGFVSIRAAKFGDAADAMFSRVENAERFVEDGITEVAIEARRP